jgi:hypothetical protein
MRMRRGKRRIKRRDRKATERKRERRQQQQQEEQKEKEQKQCSRRVGAAARGGEGEGVVPSWGAVVTRSLTSRGCVRTRAVGGVL